MSTNSKKDAELLAEYRKGYDAFWRSPEAQEGQMGHRRDHAAGLRAVAAAAWDEGKAAMESHRRMHASPGDTCPLPPNPYALVTDERTE